MNRSSAWTIAVCSLAAGIVLLVLLGRPDSGGNATRSTPVAVQEPFVYSWDREPPDSFIVQEVEARTSPEDFRKRAPHLSLAFRHATVERIGPRDRHLVEQQVGLIYEELRQEINGLSPECGNTTIIIWLYPQGEIGLVNGPAFYVDERGDPRLKPWAEVSKKEWMTHRYNKASGTFAEPF